MYRGQKIGVVIPAYRVQAQIVAVVRSIPAFVDRVFVIDDCCPEGSGRESALGEFPHVEILFNARNEGVGGAVQRGYRAALADGCELIVKVDGDGQMDPAYMEALVDPVAAGRADYAKGNRFRDLGALRNMPLVRLVGNSSLCILVKIASGYWRINDPTNGYTAIRAATLANLLRRNIARSYFFESDMLIHLAIQGAVVEDVRIPARYGDEQSSLAILRALLEFPPRLALGGLKRLTSSFFDYEAIDERAYPS